MRPRNDDELVDDRHKKIFSNFDKIKPESTQEYHAKDNHDKVHKICHSQGVTCSFSPHFMSRMDHKDEHTGDDKDDDKYDPHRRVSSATKQLVPHSSVKVHVRKIIKHISESKPTDEHMPTKKNPTTAVMYKHKPTGQDILVHLHHHPHGVRAQFQTYAGNQPFRAFANKARPNNSKFEKKRTETRVTLESVIYDRILGVLSEEKSLYIHQVTLA